MAEEDVIDVDNLPPATSEPSTKGEGPGKVARYQESIDVDDPAACVTHPRSSDGDPAGGRLDPHLKFDGAVDFALFEQKMETLKEAARGGATTHRDTSTAGKAVKAGGASTDDGMETPAASHSSAHGRGRGPAAAPDVPAVGSMAKNGQSSRGASVTGAGTRRRNVEMPPGHPLLALSKNRVKRSHRSRRGFVRKAAVITAVAPRMYADPPTPPGGWGGVAATSSDDDGELSNEYDGIGGCADEDVACAVGASSTAGPARPPTTVTDCAAPNTQSAVHAAAGAGDSDVRALAAGAGLLPVPMASSTSPESEQGDGRKSGPSRVVARDASAANALANQLAERSRNPRIFLTGAFWTPGAAAVLSRTQLSSGGLPPIPTPGPNRVAVAAVGAGRSPLVAGPHPFAPPAPPPALAPPVPDEGSSEEMDDDALVAAYITPPASPRFLPTVSPRQTRILSDARRRANTSRATRAPATASPAGAAVSTAADVDHAGPTLRDLLVALRTWFSSVRRETGRLRAELVVVKAQAASSLRRIDGIAAAADGSQSESGVVLERLSKLEMLLQGLNERLPKEGGDNADGGASQTRWAS